MWLEIHSDVEGKPSYTVLPEGVSDAFKKFCHENQVDVEIEQNVFRSDDKSYDFGTFRRNSIDDVRDLINEWNRQQRKASRQYID